MTLHADGSNLRKLHNGVAWVNVVCGLAVFMLRFGSPRPSFDVHRNLFFSGIVIMFAALADVIAHDGNSSKNYWSTINLAVGAWLLVSVKAIPSVEAVTIAQTTLGVLIVVVALASLGLEIVTRRQVAARTVTPQ